MSENNIHNLAISSIFNAIAEKEDAVLVFSLYAKNGHRFVAPAPGVDKEMVRRAVKQLYDTISDGKEEEIIIEL